MRAAAGRRARPRQRASTALPTATPGKGSPQSKGSSCSGAPHLARRGAGVSAAGGGVPLDLARVPPFWTQGLGAGCGKDKIRSMEEHISHN